MRGIILDDNSSYPGLSKHDKTRLIQFPHGSGIDCSWSVKETKGNFIFYNEYHAMDQNGYYCGYVPFSVSVPKWHLKHVLAGNGLVMAQINIKADKRAIKAINKDYKCKKDEEYFGPYLDDLEDYLFDTIDNWNWYMAERSKL